MKQHHISSFIDFQSLKKQDIEMLEKLFDEDTNNMYVYISPRPLTFGQDFFLPLDTHGLTLSQLLDRVCPVVLQPGKFETTQSFAERMLNQLKEKCEFDWKTSKQGPRLSSCTYSCVIVNGLGDDAEWKGAVSMEMSAYRTSVTLSTPEKEEIKTPAIPTAENNELSLN